MRSFSELHERFMQNPKYRAEYEALEWRGNRLVRASIPKEPGFSQHVRSASGNDQN